MQLTFSMPGSAACPAAALFSNSSSTRSATCEPKALHLCHGCQCGCLATRPALAGRRRQAQQHVMVRLANLPESSGRTPSLKANSANPSRACRSASGIAASSAWLPVASEATATSLPAQRHAWILDYTLAPPAPPA